MTDWQIADYHEGAKRRERALKGEKEPGARVENDLTIFDTSKVSRDEFILGMTASTQGRADQDFGVLWDQLKAQQDAARASHQGDPGA